jgi:hypothetical protein
MRRHAILLVSLCASSAAFGQVAFPSNALTSPAHGGLPVWSEEAQECRINIKSRVEVCLRPAQWRRVDARLARIGEQRYRSINIVNGGLADVD